MTILDQETRNLIADLIDELMEANQDERLAFYEGCVVQSVPTGAVPEYQTVTVDGINDPNILYRGVPPGMAQNDVVLVWENPISHRREIIGGSGPSGTSFAHAILSNAHSDAATDAVTRGSLIYGNATPDWDELIAGAQGRFLKTDATDVSWQRLSGQTLMVGPDTYTEYNTVGAAIAAVNALGDASVNKFYVILVCGGNIVETGDITLPAYTLLVGLNRGSEVRLGANTLHLSSNSGMFSLYLSSSDDGWAMRASGVTGVVLEDLYVTNTGGGYGLGIDGASNVTVRDCVIVATGAGGSEAVDIINTSTGLFDNSVLDGTGYGLLVGNTATVTTRWCRMVGGTDDVWIQSTATWNHFDCQFDPSNVTFSGGGATVTNLPTSRFNQTLIVAKSGGDSTTLSAAIAYINARADAAAGKEYGIFVLAGDYSEAAGVTIPQYVHVFGVGEGTELAMGANRITMSSNSSLANINVSGTPAGSSGLIYCNGVTGVVMRNVRASQSTAFAAVFGFAGASSVELYGCIAEATAGNVDGFYVGGTSTVTMKDCIADDTTNFLDALYLSATACTVMAVHCVFRGNTADISTGATSTVQHLGCRFDPDNSAFVGTETPLVTGSANYDAVVTFENGLTLDGASAANIVTVPDNLAQALNIVDAGGLEYMRIVSTNVQPIIDFNNAQADIDFRVAASGITNALFVRGSDGFIAIGHNAPVGPLDLTWNHGTLATGVTTWTMNVSGSCTSSAAAGVDALRCMVFSASADGSDELTELTAIQGSTWNNLTGNKIVTMQAMSVDLRLANAGNVTVGYGYRAVPILSSTGSIITSWSGFEARAPIRSAGSGTIPTAIGVDIKAQRQSFVTTGYGIYGVGASDRNYLAGTLSVGGTVAALGQVHVDQSSTTAAIPVLILDQADVSEEMIEFITTIGVGNAIEAVGAKTLTTTHFIKITLPGALTRYIPCGTIA